jgi:hypothetical protein
MDLAGIEHKTLVSSTRSRATFACGQLACPKREPRARETPLLPNPLDRDVDRPRRVVKVLGKSRPAEHWKRPAEYHLPFLTSLNKPWPRFARQPPLPQIYSLRAMNG